MRLHTAVTAGLLASAMALTAFAAISANAQSVPAAVEIAQAGLNNQDARLRNALLALKDAQKALRAAKESGKGVAAASEQVRQARDEVKAARQAALAAGAPADTPDMKEGREAAKAAEEAPAAPAAPAESAAGRQRAAPAGAAKRQRQVPPAAPAETVAEQPPATVTAPVSTGNPQARLQAAILAEQDAQKAFRAARNSGRGEQAARARLRQARQELNAAKQAVAELAGQQAPAAAEQIAPGANSTETENAAEPEVKTGIAGETVDPQVQELRRKLRQARQRAQQAEQSAAEAQAKAGGGEVVRRESDRVIIRFGDQVIIRSQDENERFLRNANDVVVVQLPDGRTRTTVIRPNGVQIITVTNRFGEIIYRVRRLPNGQEIVLIDNRQQARPVVNFDIRLPRLVVPIPRQDYIVDLQRASEADLRTALRAPPVERVERIYSLEEVRRSERLRDKVRRVDLDTVTFDSGSAAISRSQVRALTQIGEALEDVLYEDPDEIFLVEGHTDAVGSALYNLALSDRRAESVAIILSESFDIPPENLITQGYGEDYLKIPTSGDERRNRRVTIRRITPLIRADAQ
jgi:outer membrane protein OmpA-like peptidoglycan-associated protein